VSNVNLAGKRRLDLDASTSEYPIYHLTDEERDQIDLHAKSVISKCAEHVKEMEALEKSAPSHLDMLLGLIIM
jgi:syntaxin 18